MLSLPPVADPIRDALQARADHLSKLVGWANITVAIGVALEGVEIVHDIVTWGKNTRRRRRERIDLKEIAEVFPTGELIQSTKLHADESRCVKRLLRVGLIIVVIGVVAEWRCGTKLEDAHNAIHQHDLEKIAAADEFAIQTFMRTRPRIVKMGRAKFAEKLRGVSPSKVEVLYKPEDGEAYLLALAIVGALGPKDKGGVGWDVSGPRPLTEKDAVDRPASVWGTDPKNVPLIVRAGAANGLGLIVKLPPSYPPPDPFETPTKATGVWALLYALQAANIFPFPVEANPKMPPDVIRVVVGEITN